VVARIHFGRAAGRGTDEQFHVLPRFAETVVAAQNLKFTE
jgi:hypothetical protein